MAMDLVRCISQPGIKRDGTLLDGNNYSDATWCRWQRQLPRKIGGYKQINPYLSGISRQLFGQSKTGQQYIHSGWSGGIDRFLVDNSGVSSVVASRTPGAYVANANAQWQFDTQFDNTSATTLLLAHPNTALLDPADAGSFAIYFGDIYGLAALAPVTLNANIPAGVSGGIVSLAPYLVAYGSDGFWANSVVGKPTDFTNAGSQATRITGQKILKGLPLRSGGGSSPAGLFWSVNAVTRATFVGGTTIFNYDQLTTQSSLLSESCVIENDGIFYWAGVDRFLMYNGAVQEIPNTMNLNWFFDGINKANAGKSFAMKVPRFGEIWWCYPRGAATECSHAVIYNYREKTWYDTPLPNTGRSSGIRGDALIGNIMGGIVLNSNTLYNLWQHEQGTDEIDGSQTVAIQSNFTTATITRMSSQQPTEEGTTIQAVLPDFVQSMDMTVTVLKQNNAKSAVVAGAVGTIYATPATAEQQITPLKDTAKIMQLKFESNVAGGDYQMGQTMMVIGADGKKRL